MNSSTVTDFPLHTSVTLNAGQTITYQDTFTFSNTGSYSFFAAYQTQDGVWRIGLNHEIPSDPGISELVTLNVTTSCSSPGTFTLSSPSNGQSLSPTSSVDLTWQPSSNADSYDVYFGTSSNPGFWTNVTGTSLNVSVTAGQMYWWKVLARVSCNSSLSFSTAIWSFSVQTQNYTITVSASPSGGAVLVAAGHSQPEVRAR